MIPREWLKKIRQIELRTVRLVEDLMAGQYHSVFKGRGMDFDEVREYQPGDEVRRIDWNVTARTGVAHIKKYIEEREMTVMILVDASASSVTGSVELSKRELAAELAAVLAFSAIKNNDKVGALLFTDGTEKYIRPGKGRLHVLRLISEVLTYNPASRGTNLTKALHHINRALSRRAVIFVISDFMDRNYERALKVTSRKHDLIAVPIVDPTERNLPDLGWIAFEDAETGQVVEINTSSAKAREAFAAAAEERIGRLRHLFRRSGLDSIEAQTDQPYLRNMMQFFEKPHPEALGMNPPGDLIDDLQLVEPPEPFRMNWWYVAAGVAALLLVIVSLRIRGRTKLIRLQAAKIRRAWVDALEELERLFALIDKEESRNYAVESSAIIRHYIEDRFELSASRQSTEEFLESAQHSPKLELRHQQSLGEFLQICDLLKFAKTMADKQELRNLHDAAVAFVKETRPQKTEVQPA